MGAVIDEKMIPAGDPFYYSDAYKVFVESHLTHLRTHERTQTIEVDPGDAHVYQFDLHFYLLRQGYDFNEHYLILRMNGMSSAHDFREDTRRLLLPDREYVLTLTRLFRTSTK